MRGTAAGHRRAIPVAALALLGAGFFLRVWRIALPSLRGDEAFSWMIARQDPGSILRFIWEAREPHSPLPFLWMKVWIGWAGDGEFTLRFHSLFLTFLILPLVGWWLRSLGRDRAIAIAGMALASVHPYLIWQSQDARQYGTLAFFGVAEPAALLQALRTGRKRDWALFILIGTLGAYYHYNLIILFALQGLWIVAFRRRLLRPWGMAQGAVLMLFLPGAILAGHALAPYSGTAQRAPALLDGLYQIARAFTVGTTGDGLAAAAAIAGWTLAAGIGAWRSFRSSLEEGLWLIGHLAAPIAATFLVARSRSVFAPHYMITALPFWILLAAIGMGELRGGKPWRWGFLGLCSLGIGLGFAQSLVHYYADPRYAKSPPIRELTAELHRKAQPGDYALITFPDPSFTYYHRDAIPWGMLPSIQPFQRAETLAALERLALQHQRIWLIPIHLPMWPGSEEVERWLRLHAELREEQAFGPLRLLAFRPEARALAEMRPATARWADGIELVAFRLEPEGAVPRGGRLRVSTAWRRWGEVREEHSVFVHLLDETGRLIAQDDHPVGRGSYPSVAWSGEEILFECFDLKIPEHVAPGRYRLVIGRYNWETLIRIPVGTSDHLELGIVEVGP